MKRKKRYIARLGEVVITRRGETAEISYKEEGVPTTNVRIGTALEKLSDAEVLAWFNESLAAEAKLAASYKHVAVEVPLGSPQIELRSNGQWVPRGGVVRCIVHDNEDGELLVEIDDRELSLHEFGRMLTTDAGWGMRIEFTPEEDIHRRPVLEVKEPEADED